MQWIMFNFYPELPHFIQISTTLLTRFPRYWKRSIRLELVEVVAILIFACLCYRMVGNFRRYKFFAKQAEIRVQKVSQF